MKTLFILSALLISSLTLSAQCNSHKQKSHTKTISYSQSSHRSLVEIAAGDDRFSTLVAALKAADLVDALEGDGPFTIFAPDNTAFDRLADGTVASLLEPGSKKQLQEILTYHVVAANLSSDDVTRALSATGRASLESLSGKKITVLKKGSSLFIEDGQGNLSLLKAFDIEGTNGVIHVIDMVLLP